MSDGVRNDEAATLSIIGTRRPRLDGREKVSGRARFTDDFAAPDLLHARVLRSPHASARIVRIDTTRAESLEGVRGVITAASVGGMCVRPGQPLFAREYVKFIGDEVAAVAAISEEIAERALELIEVEYEPRPAVVSLRKALKASAPRVDPDSEGNCWNDAVTEYGEFPATFERAEQIFDDEFKCSATHSVLSELHVAVADFSDPGRLVVRTPLQGVVTFQAALAQAFGLRNTQVQLLFLHVGGAFTGRGSPRPHHFIAAILSRRTGQPVKVRAMSDAEFVFAPATGESEMRFRTAVDPNGTLLGFEVDALTEAGAHPHLQAIVHHMPANYVTWPFRIRGARYRNRLVLTNTAPTFCHHGGPMGQLNAGWMPHLTRVAERLGLDPIDFFLRNAASTGDQALDGAVFGSCGLRECLTRVREESGWDRKYGQLPKYRGIGVGVGALCVGTKGKFFHDTSSAIVKVADDGRVAVWTGIPDMGQGTHTTMAMIAAEVLGVPWGDVSVVAGDSDITPFDLGAYAQRGTFITGNAVLRAAEDARRQLAEVAAASLEVRPDDLVFRDGRVWAVKEPLRSMSVTEAAHRTLHSGEGRAVIGRGFFNPPVARGASAYSFGAQVAEVEVDPDTGMVRVERVTVAHDLGRALNPLAVEGQIDGQVVSGIAQVLYEECIRHDGQVMNGSRLEYKWPRSYELPEIRYILVESIDPYGPFGAKEVGEGPIAVTMGAVAAAVANAVGAIVPRIPMTPWRILETLRRAQ